MPKKLVAKVGEFTNQQGETKGRYVNLGVVMANANGSYVLLDPTVSLSGILSAQNVMAANKGEQQRDRVMISVFEEQNQNQKPQQQTPYQQQPQAPQPQQPQAQQGGFPDYSDDVPFANPYKGYELIV